MTKTRVAALAASLALAATSLSGCQLLLEQTTPSFPPATATANPTPPETAQERMMRLDQEAAVKAYLTARKETDRLLMAGGANKPTKTLLATTAGEYLETKMYVLETFKEKGWRTDRAMSTVVFADGGWSPNSIGLTACEDDSKARFLDKRGKEVFKDRDHRYVQTLTATREDGVWKITNSESKAVKSFETEGNCGS